MDGRATKRVKSHHGAPDQQHDLDGYSPLLKDGLYSDVTLIVGPAPDGHFKADGEILCKRSEYFRGMF